MTRYLFHPIADAEQDEISGFTRDRWGQRQAETYIRELHAHLELLGRLAVSGVPYQTVWAS